MLCYVLIFFWQGKLSFRNHPSLKPLKMHYKACRNRLKEGGLETSSLSDDGLIAIGEGFPKLERLSLIWCSSVSSEGLLGISENCRYLKSLDLQVNL